MQEKYLPYFEEIAREDVAEILTVCDVASARIAKKFKLTFDDPKLLAATWSKIYETIIAKLKTLEERYSDFNINICDRLNIGYSTNLDEEDEKQGNFMIHVTHLDHRKKTEDFEDPYSKPEERCSQWNTENIIEQPKIMAELAVEALDALKVIDVHLGSREYIFPIFSLVYEELVNYLITKRREKDDYEFEINFISCFNIGARETDDIVNDDIYIRPNIEGKLTLKSDKGASNK